MGEQPGAIRTPDHRLRVFISSTLGELAAERQAAREAVERLRLAPIMFELGARPHPPRALYRAYLEQSDVFVGIYWQRYGWVAPDMDISGLEDEYRLSQGMPRLMYVKRPAGKVEPRLAELLQRVEDESTASYRPFRDADELQALLVDDLAILLTERFDAVAAAPAAASPVHTNLPTPASTFVGREQLLTDLRRLLDDGDTRLVTLTGPGGTGKTRLAVEAARASLDQFRDGVFLVDLTEEREPDDAYAAMVRALPTGKTSEESALDALKRGLRDRQMLLLLDNFEQVPQAAVGLVDLLERCPQIKTLVTSRVALHVRPERRFAVPPLGLPPGDGDAPAANGMDSEAVRLFSERAAAVDGSFELTAANLSDVVAICARLDGLPLAIELAAARVSLFGVEELRDRVAQQVSVLGRGGGDLPARQQTLRQTLEWSNDLLMPAEQRMLQLFSVFFDARITDIEATVGRMSPEPSIDPVDGVGSLVDKSLVHSVSRADRRPRFSMLQTIRDFAAEELDRDPALAESTRRAHAEYYSELAAGIGSAESDRTTTLDRLSSDLANFRAAWSHWVAAGDVARLNGLLEPLWTYYEAHGNYRAAVDLGEELLAVLRTQPATPDRARDELALEMSLAQSLIAVGGYSAAVEQRIREVLDHTRAAGSAPHRFPALRSLATLHMLRADFPRSAEVTPLLVSIAEEQRDPALLSEAHLLEGMSALWREGAPPALAHVDQAVEYSEARPPTVVRLRVGPDPAVLSNAVSGLLAWTCGYPDRAEARALRALQIAEESGHPYSLCYGLFHVSLLDFWREEFERLQQRADHLYRTADAFNYPIWRALAQVLRGTAAVAAGSPESGLADLEGGFAVYRGLATPPVFWPGLIAIKAAANLLAGRIDEARAVIETADLDANNPTSLDVVMLHGDILVAASSQNASAAEERYRHVLGAASSAGLRMAELQAATRLTNLLRGTPAHAAEADRLRGVVDQFTEGFDTPQYRAARSALDD